MKKRSLRRRFLRQVLIALLAIVVLSSFIQIFFIKKEISNDMQSQADIVAQNVLEGINQTETASKSIEHQIDLRMLVYAKNISLLLKNKKVDQITAGDLDNAKKQLGLNGITIFKRKNDDIVGIKSTDPKEIGFSFKSFGEDAYNNMDAIMRGEISKDTSLSLSQKGIIILPISQSGSHDNHPIFNKYAYYHPPGTDYIINPYIEDNQIYQFTQEVGPDSQIKKLIKGNNNVTEIAVLNPSVFKDPDLEKSLYSPLKKVEFGHFDYKTKSDVQLLKEMVDHSKKQTVIEKVKGKKVYQMFIPSSDGRVIYIAFDYKKMSLPLYRHSIILVLTGLISLIVLFLLTARFFNRIYENIQKVKRQINKLETGDLTAKSNVTDGSELEELSMSSNKMAEQLNSLVKDTQKQAHKTQRLSVMLENDASQSIDKMYQISAEATMHSRDQLNEITEFIDNIEKVLQPYAEQQAVKSLLMDIGNMKGMAKDLTTVTTEITITLADLLKSLYEQSEELSDISGSLIQHMEKFNL